MGKKGLCFVNDPFKFGVRKLSWSRRDKRVPSASLTFSLPVCGSLGRQEPSCWWPWSIRPQGKRKEPSPAGWIWGHGLCCSVTTHNSPLTYSGPGSRGLRAWLGMRIAFMPSFLSPPAMETEYASAPQANVNMLRKVTSAWPSGMKPTAQCE